MNRNLLLSVIVLSVVAVCMAQTPESRTKSGALHSPESAKPISVREFARDRVIGHLGHPLGTIVRVTGKAIDGDSMRMKALAGKTLLEIRTVNGKALESPATFVFGRAAEGIDKPAPGDDFDYYVHEYGAFDGIVDPPPGLDIEHVVVAHDGFYYRKQITIHKSLK